MFGFVGYIVLLIIIFFYLNVENEKFLDYYIYLF